VTLAAAGLSVPVCPRHTWPLSDRRRKR